MPSGVVVRNVTTNVNEVVLHITKGVQTCDANVSEEWGYDRSEGEDDAHALIVNEILVLPPPIASGKHGYV
jgi:uncharacterized protein YcnI